MCGIAGVWQLGASSGDRMAAALHRMTDAIAHRGPDDQGCWVHASAGVGFGHRRLSIVDLSALGHQPMTSASGRYVLSYNGEIYNYRDLRRELESFGHGFRGGSDTEVLLAAIEQWGLQEALVRSRGMFAMALWDHQERSVALARDRFGEKPLYFGTFQRTLLFGSELKALRQHADWRGDIDRGALTLMLRHGYIPAPFSIFQRVRKVRPGHIVNVSAGSNQFSIREHGYWNTREELQAAAADPFRGSPQEALDETERLLSASVARQMVADVPVGAFLSGGIDSSLTVALMQQASSRAVRTFTIGFGEREFNEAPYARAVAEHLQTDHTELTVTPGDALGVIPRLPQMYDEPFADGSQIPTYLVSALARRAVTVSLSGDAGDELFGGYSRYGLAESRWQRLRRVPRALRWAASSLLGSASRPALRALSRASKRRPDYGDRIWEKARELKARSAAEYYGEMHSYFHWPQQIARSAGEPPTVANSPQDWPAGLDSLRLMMYQDTCLYMPDDVLVKVDRASMAVSLESRIPLLDPAVARWAWRIPTTMHFADGRGKWVLRSLLERHVPRPLIDRTKTGFGVPIASWLRADLRDWAESLLEPARLATEGFFDPYLVTARWHQHLRSPAVDWSYHLWIILMFQAWLEHWKAPGALERSPDPLLQRAS